MLDGDATDLAGRVDLKDGVLVKIPRFGRLNRPKLNEDRVRILEILHFHG